MSGGVDAGVGGAAADGGFGLRGRGRSWQSGRVGGMGRDGLARLAYWVGTRKGYKGQPGIVGWFREVGGRLLPLGIHGCVVVLVCSSLLLAASAIGHLLSRYTIGMEFTLGVFDVGESFIALIVKDDSFESGTFAPEPGVGHQGTRASRRMVSRQAIKVPGALCLELWKIVRGFYLDHRSMRAIFDSPRPGPFEGSAPSIRMNA